MDVRFQNGVRLFPVASLSEMSPGTCYMHDGDAAEIFMAAEYAGETVVVNLNDGSMMQQADFVVDYRWREVKAQVVVNLQ